MPLKKPSDAQLDQLYRIAILVTNKIRNSDVIKKNHSLAVKAITGLIVLGMTGTTFYYVMTHHIAPLMIYVACMLPILAYGLAQSSSNLEKLSKEYQEYSTAMGKLIASLAKVNPESIDNVTEALAASIVAATTIVPKSIDQVTFGDLRRLDAFKTAVSLAENLITLDDTIDSLKKEGVDVDAILASMDTMTIDADSLDQLEAQLENYMGHDTEENSTEASTAKQDTKPSEITDDKNDPHIISSTVDESQEDLNIVV